MASERAKRMMAAWVRQGRTEQVTYRPARDGLAARTINALVDRPGAVDVMSGQVLPFRVTVLNDATDGIPSDPTLSDVGADRVDVAERVGGTAAARGVQRFAEQDPDWVTAELM